MQKPTGSVSASVFLAPLGFGGAAMLENCNGCSYSSVVRRDGVVKLHCGLVGKTLDQLVEDCPLAEDPQLRMLEYFEGIPEDERIAC
jgi:hypothetical protein